MADNEMPFRIWLYAIHTESRRRYTEKQGAEWQSPEAQINAHSIAVFPPSGKLTELVMFLIRGALNLCLVIE